MDKKLYCTLLLLVNNKEQLQRLQEYAAARIANYHRLLEMIKDHHHILEIQGAIAEVKRFGTLEAVLIKGLKSYQSYNAVLDHLALVWKSTRCRSFEKCND